MLDFGRGVTRAPLLLLALAGALPASAGSAEEPKLSELSQVVTGAAADDVSVVLTGSRAPDFTSFTMNAPFRVVVDWAGSRLVGVPEERRFEQGLVRRITTRQFDAESEKISRITIELARETTYHVEAVGKTVVVHFAPISDPKPTEQPTPSPAVAVAEERAEPAKSEPEQALTEPLTAVPDRVPELRKEPAAAVAGTAQGAAAPTKAEPQRLTSDGQTQAVAAKSSKAGASPKTRAVEVAASTVKAAAEASAEAAAVAKAEPTQAAAAVAKAEPTKATLVAKAEPTKATLVAEAEPTKAAAAVAKAEPMAATLVAKAEPTAATLVAKAEPTAATLVAKAEPTKAAAVVANAEPTKAAAAVAKAEPTKAAAVVAKTEPTAATLVAEVEPTQAAAAVAKAEPTKAAAVVAKAEPTSATLVAKVEPTQAAAAVAKAEPTTATQAAAVVAKAEPTQPTGPSKPQPEPGVASGGAGSDGGGVRLASFGGRASERSAATERRADPAVRALSPPTVRVAREGSSGAERLASSGAAGRERVAQWQPPSVPLSKKLPVVRYASAGEGQPLRPTAQLPADPDEPAVAEAGQAGSAQVTARPDDPAANDFEPGLRVMKYIGFQQMAAASRVFVRLDGKAKYRPSLDGTAFVLELLSTHINVKNNERMLDTTYFDTPVQKIQAVPAGDTTRIEIKLKEPVPYKIQRIGNMIAIDFQRAK